MRKVLLFAPMILLLLLAGCAETTEQRVKEIQAYYRDAPSITAETALRCHFGTEVRDYVLACEDSTQRAKVTVIAPENVSGIAAVLEGEEMKLSYEDVLLDAGVFSGTELTPFWAVPAFLRALGEGYPLEYGMDGDFLRVTFEVTEENGEKRLHTAWFTEENRVVRGEITVEGAVVYELDLTMVTTEEQEDGTTAEENLGGDRSGRPEA